LKNDKHKINLFLVIGFLFGVYCFVFGQSGLLERSRLDQQRAQLDSEIEELKQINKVRSDLYLAYKNGMYNKIEAHKAGYVSLYDKVIFFNETGRKNGKNKRQKESIEAGIGIQELRYIYMIISGIIILGLIIRIRMLMKNIVGEI
jgi:cell division protein FtsB